MDEDISQIYSLNYYYRKLGLAGPLYKSWIRRAIDQNRISVIKLNNKVVAFMIFTELKIKPLFTLQKIFILDKLHGRGYGNKLLGRLKKLAINKNKGIQVRTSANNENAISFYKKNGFIQLDDPSTRPKRYESVYLLWNNK